MYASATLHGFFCARRSLSDATPRPCDQRNPQHGAEHTRARVECTRSSSRAHASRSQGRSARSRRATRVRPDFLILDGDRSETLVTHDLEWEIVRYDNRDRELAPRSGASPGVTRTLGP